jgi:hypothetical protein
LIHLRPRDCQSPTLMHEALTSTSLRRLSRNSPVPYDDQAEKHFSPGKLKPTYFLNKEELLKHVESKKVLRRPLTSK